MLRYERQQEKFHARKPAGAGNDYSAVHHARDRRGDCDWRFYDLVFDSESAVLDARLGDYPGAGHDRARRHLFADAALRGRQISPVRSRATGRAQVDADGLRPRPRALVLTASGFAI
jgi:hypothetical protein